MIIFPNSVFLYGILFIPHEINHPDFPIDIDSDPVICNQPTSLDLSVNSKLFSLSCGSNLITVLDVNPVTAMEQLYVLDMPTLFKICLPEIPGNIYIDFMGSPNMYLSKNCNQER